MKKVFLAVLAVFMILALTGCGDGGHNGPVLVTTDILSDPFYDGDISDTSVVSHSNVTQNVVAGIDPINRLEYRAFLDFHLTGANGVPGNAIIDSAFLDIFIDNISTQLLTDTIPLQIDLVSFQPPDLIASDFNRPALPIPPVRLLISQADFRRFVTIDVTPLMVEAQRLGLLDFQIRIMEDLRFNVPGLVVINNTIGVDRGTLAPLLTVTYF